jgi:hypothetical protein
MADCREHCGKQSQGECIEDVNKFTRYEIVFRKGIKYLGSNWLTQQRITAPEPAALSSESETPAN